MGQVLPRVRMSLFIQQRWKRSHVAKHVEAGGGRIAVRVTSDFYCLIDDSERGLDNSRHADMRIFGPVPGIRIPFRIRLPWPFSSFSPFFFSLPLLFSFLKYISRSIFHFLTDAVCYYFLRFQRHCQVFLDDFSEMKASGFSEKLIVCTISLFWGFWWTHESWEFKTLLQDSWQFSNSSDKIP